MQSPEKPRAMTLRWVTLAFCLLALIVIPFLVWGRAIEEWTGGILAKSSEHTATVAFVLGGLLAVDILLPVPSSLVSTGCGLCLGFWKGFAVSFGGMTISCLAGYLLGRVGGRPLVERMVGKGGLARMEALGGRAGDWVVIAARAVPVLAESSVLAAGAAGMPFGRFLLLVSVSNCAVSAVYAAAGAYAARWNSFLLAFLFSVTCPGVVLLFSGRRRQAA